MVRVWDSGRTNGVKMSHFVFALFLSKVADVWNPEGEGGGWTPQFSRAFNDWGLEIGERFLLKIQATRMQRDVDDMVIWTASRCGNFSVKSLYSVLEPGDPLLFPSSSIRRSCAPSKVAFFAWKATWGKVLTLDQIQRRGFYLANRCFICHSKVEIVDSWVLWHLFFSLFGVS